jgi:hypothetical protein
LAADVVPSPFGASLSGQSGIRSGSAKAKLTREIKRNVVCKIGIFKDSEE